MHACNVYLICTKEVKDLDMSMHMQLITERQVHAHVHVNLTWWFFLVFIITPC
jgi:hypothetical protein